MDLLDDHWLNRLTWVADELGSMTETLARLQRRVNQLAGDVAECRNHYQITRPESESSRVR